mmetsp:Transcript_22275/g.39853  ORF Transcript_22275/g.39853 Transcript_22275/m.39853 type:complete len:91 (-) Transcript_22275:81-353(-)
MDEQRPPADAEGLATSSTTESLPLTDEGVSHDSTRTSGAANQAEMALERAVMRFLEPLGIGAEGDIEDTDAMGGVGRGNEEAVPLMFAPL